jgi:outer membrane protein assembly factor BamE (lipoprotein component of BamABCDE complex)
MPYYVFRIQSGPTAIVKQLDPLKEFEVFKEAQDFAKQTRTEITDNSQVKVMFADNQLQAEEQLMEKRDKPILREWER